MIFIFLPLFEIGSHYNSNLILYFSCFFFFRERSILRFYTMYKIYMICLRYIRWGLILLCIRFWTDTDSSRPSNTVWLLANWGNWVPRSFPRLPRRTRRCWVVPYTCRQSDGRWYVRRRIERLGRWSPSMSVDRKH